MIEHNDSIEGVMRAEVFDLHFAIPHEGGYVRAVAKIEIPVLESTLYAKICTIRGYKLVEYCIHASTDGMLAEHEWMTVDRLRRVLAWEMEPPEGAAGHPLASALARTLEFRFDLDALSPPDWKVMAESRTRTHGSASRFYYGLKRGSGLPPMARDANKKALDIAAVLQQAVSKRLVVSNGKLMRWVHEPVLAVRTNGSARSGVVVEVREWASTKDANECVAFFSVDRAEEAFGAASSLAKRFNGPVKDQTMGTAAFATGYGRIDTWYLLWGCIRSRLPEAVLAAAIHMPDEALAAAAAMMTINEQVDGQWARLNKVKPLDGVAWDNIRLGLVDRWMDAWNVLEAGMGDISKKYLHFDANYRRLHVMMETVRSVVAIGKPIPSSAKSPPAHDDRIDDLLRSCSDYLQFGGERFAAAWMALRRSSTGTEIGAAVDQLMLGPERITQATANNRWRESILPRMRDVKAALDKRQLGDMAAPDRPQRLIRTIPAPERGQDELESFLVESLDDLVLAALQKGWEIEHLRESIIRILPERVEGDR